MKLDVLVITPHPDDAELGCGGTILSLLSKGLQIGILDLTRGELGTRGNQKLRSKEATASAKILGVNLRENLGLSDGFFKRDKPTVVKIIQKLRLYKPDIIFTSAVSDRHPDHGRGSQLVKEAVFLSGLSKINTSFNRRKQSAWRPRALYHVIQARNMRPDVIVDISAYFEKKMEAVRCFSSQFHNPKSLEPETYISSQIFMESIEARCKDFGMEIGVAFGEGFIRDGHIGIEDITQLI